MATLADLVAEMETDIDAIAGGTRSRMSQDYGDQTKEFTALDTTRYQIQATHLGISNETSEASRTVVQVEVFVHHALASYAGEQAYRDGQMSTDQLAMLQESFWNSMASVYDVLDGFPAVNEQPERIGKRIMYSVGLQLQLA